MSIETISLGGNKRFGVTWKTPTSRTLIIRTNYYKPRYSWPSGSQDIYSQKLWVWFHFKKNRCTLYKWSLRLLNFRPKCLIIWSGFAEKIVKKSIFGLVGFYLDTNANARKLLGYMEMMKRSKTSNGKELDTPKENNKIN